MKDDKTNLDEANFADIMKKAFDAHERGDHKRAKYHLDNAKTARYGLKSSEISKHKELLDKYKELRDMHEEVELDEAMSVADKSRAHEVHKVLKSSDSVGQAYGLKIKAAHAELKKKYGSDWRKKAGINEEEEVQNALEEMFSQAQIQRLKAEYSKINTIDPSSPTYKKLVDMLNKQDQETLKKLAGADIKFISGLARNRIKKESVDYVKEEAELKAAVKESLLDDIKAAAARAGLKATEYQGHEKEKAKRDAVLAKKPKPGPWRPGDNSMSSPEAYYKSKKPGEYVGDSYQPQLQKFSEWEQLSELTTKKLDQYTAAANKDFEKAKQSGDSAKMYKRGKGMMQAAVKKIGNTVKGMKEASLDEELTDKTIRSSDKIKVARVIADMLGVEKAESMSPEAAIRQGLMNIKNKRMTPELVGVVRKMLALAREVGVKVDTSMVPRGIEEAVVDPKKKDNAAGDILRFDDFQKLKKLNKGEIDEDQDQPESHDQAHDADKVDTIENIPTQVGHTMQHPYNDHMRRRKVVYKTDESVEQDEEVLEEDMQSADYKVNPNTGRKSRAHHINFKNSTSSMSPSDLDSTDDEPEKPITSKPLLKKVAEDAKQEDKSEDEDDISEEDLEDIANDVDDIDDVIDEYDDDELKIVDEDTGEDVEEEEVNEQALNEVLSRAERMKARIRFAKTSAKRARRLKIVLHRRSDAKTLNKRARRLAIKLVKQRLMKKPVSKLSTTEKERVEKMLQNKGALINRLAMRLIPRVRKIENERMSHHKK